MSDYKLDIGINLNDRKLSLNIPNETEISDLKYICKTDNTDNYIAEENNKGYFHYVKNGEEINEIFYEKNNVNLNEIVLPKHFGIIVEIDDTAVLYEYLKRTANEKVYTIGEDFSREESMKKDDIQTEIEENIRSYGVPNDSVIGFDGDEIPNGYVEVGIDNIITAGASQSITATESGEIQVPITKAVEQIGNGFTITNNKIIIGENINKVLISAQVYCNLAANRGGVLNFCIKKNGTYINGQTNSGYANSETRNACLSLSPKLVSVEPGDYFEYYVYAYNGDVIRSDNVDNTFMTIQAIDGDIDESLVEFGNELDSINGEVINS